MKDLDMCESAKFFVNIKLRPDMFRTIFLCILYCFAVNGCAALPNTKQPQISKINATVIDKQMVALFPSYKNEGEIRKLLEISFSSNSDVISESLSNDMSLRAIVGFCNDFYHISGLAFPSIHYQGNTIEHYLINNSVPKVSSADGITYQVYINYLEYEKIIKANADAKLCLQISGASYISNFESNIIIISNK